jgi:DNA adenine methylase
MSKLKTPLRYPGGKSKATTKMAPYFPPKNNVKHYREPFLGGGSVALWMTENYNLESVWVNDLYWHLYNFWKHLQSDGEMLADELHKAKTDNNTPDKARVLFGDSRAILNDDRADAFKKAAAFWIVNKCSYSGLTESSTFSAGPSDSNFSLQGIENLREYSKIIKNWKITNLSYDELLKDADDDTFIYLDPPYEIDSKLYGKRGSMHKSFDHDLFAENCNGVNLANLAISYNADQSVKDRFPDWNQIEFPLTYTLRADRKNYRKDQSKRMELLLTNYD